MRQVIYQRRVHKVNGFSLMEVLVALLILSVGLLGLAGMQVSGLRGVSNATDYTLASLALNDLAERMRANPVGLDLGNFTGYNFATADCETPTRPTPFCITTSDTTAGSCTPSEMVVSELYSWFCGDSPNSGVKDNLPGFLMPAVGPPLIPPIIQCDDIDTTDAACSPGSAHIITLTWTALNERRDSNADDTTERLSVSMRVLP